MSTSISSDSSQNQRRGYGNSGKPFVSNKISNGPKADYDDIGSWRGQQRQNYSSNGGPSDSFNHGSYYGSMQHHGNFGGTDSAPWSGNGDVNYGNSGYEPSAHGGHYNLDAGYNGSNANGQFTDYGGNQGYGYAFQNTDESWGQNRKHYNDYYREGTYNDRVKMAEHGMGNLSVSGDKDHSHSGYKDYRDAMAHSGPKKSWASIASQPARSQTTTKKKPGMPPPPIIPGSWESKTGGVAKAPIAAPIQAPRQSAWETPKPMPPPGPPMHVPNGPPNVPPMGNGSFHGRGYQGQTQQHPSSQHPPMMGYNMPPLSAHPPVAQNKNPPPPDTNDVEEKQGSVLSEDEQDAAQNELLEKIAKNEYNPENFDLSAEGARFFVIKSYSEDDIHRSIKYEVWCSTEHGNKRLDQAFKERQDKGPIYLFFSVNGSGHFCGVAEMKSPLDYEAKLSVWSQDKWKGQFKVKWIYVKDVPNTALKHIRLENNENKPVTNSRDTQEVPFEKGKHVLKIMHSFHHSTSIFDDFIHYEERQKIEEDQRRKPAPPQGMRNDRIRNGSDMRGGMDGRGNMMDRNGIDGSRGSGLDRGMGMEGRGGGFQGKYRDNMDGVRPNHGRMNHNPGRDYDRPMMHNHRDFRDSDRDGHGYGRGGRGDFRDARGDRDRDFYHHRDRDRGGRGMGRPMRN